MVVTAFMAGIGAGASWAWGVGDTADLSMSMNAPAEAAASADASSPAPVVFTATISNTGPATATSVTFDDHLPPNGTFLSSSPSCGQPAHGVLTCVLSDMAPGTQTTVTVTIGAPLSAADGPLANRASVSGKQKDPTPANNAASASTVIHDAFGNVGNGGGTISTPSIDKTHSQGGVLSVPAGFLSATTTGSIDDTLAHAPTCDTTEPYGNPVVVDLDTTQVSFDDPLVVSLVYGKGVVPPNEPLGHITVVRRARDGSCLLLPHCSQPTSGKFAIPPGAPACEGKVSRNRPTGVVTVTVLDSNDASYRGGG
jgi:uncharacterized repeat protein (TIGR01451 family)